MTSRLTILALVALVALAGCTAPPTSGDSGSDVVVEVANDSDEDVVITVGAAPPGHQGLAVEFVNGTVREYPDASGIGDLPEAVVPRVVSLRPVGDDVEVRIYRWEGSQGATATFEDVPRNATIFYSVASPTGTEPMRTLGTLGCSEAATLVDVSLRVTQDGSIAASSNCRVE